MKRIISRIAMLAVCLIVMGVATNVLAAQAKPPPPRFVDNLDGTITDTRTELMWEKKTGSVSTLIFCTNLTDCPEPSNVNNAYLWSSSGSAADGSLFTNFLPKMNCIIAGNDAVCGAGPYSDWRIPTIAELRTILTAEAPNCTATPCINPIFGPTQPSVYSSSTTFAPSPDIHWTVNLGGGSLSNVPKNGFNFVRAVRGGR